MFVDFKFMRVVESTANPRAYDGNIFLTRGSGNAIIWHRLDTWSSQFEQYTKEEITAWIDRSYGWRLSSVTRGRIVFEISDRTGAEDQEFSIMTSGLDGWIIYDLLKCESKRFHTFDQAFDRLVEHIQARESERARKEQDRHTLTKVSPDLVGSQIDELNPYFLNN